MEFEVLMTCNILGVITIIMICLFHALGKDFVF